MPLHAVVSDERNWYSTAVDVLDVERNTFAPNPEDRSGVWYKRLTALEVRQAQEAATDKGFTDQIIYREQLGVRCIVGWEEFTHPTTGSLIIYNKSTLLADIRMLPWDVLLGVTNSAMERHIRVRQEIKNSLALSEPTSTPENGLTDNATSGNP